MIYFYDLETYPNFFLATFKNRDTGAFYEFEISDRTNDTVKLRKFLKQPKLRLVGFNNLNFDYPILHKTILHNNQIWTAEDIYEQVKVIFNDKYSSIWDKYIKVPQLDLYKVWHYDNKNKATSLKWLEFAMRMSSVEDLPYKPGTYLKSDEMDIVKEYCKHDINATHKFYLKSTKHISIRQFYSKLEGINLINGSEIAMSKAIFGKYLAKEMKISQKQLRELRTIRKSFPVKDIIFDYIKFEDPKNQETLEKFKNHIWVDTSEMSKKEKEKYLFKFSSKYFNVQREYAEGGLHSFGEPGIYNSDDEYMIYDLDFASYYPHLSFVNGLHPEHIPSEIFNTLYKGFYDKRKEFPKSDPRNYVLKIILNGSYGLSKDKYAFLYDPKWQMAICVNGQLLLTMLTEKVMKVTTDSQICFENTDGAAFRIKRSEKHLVDAVCKEMEELCGIALEAQECKTLIMTNVNNYINVITDDYVKFKGCFEIDRDFHKNHSKRVVPLALANYYLNGVSPEDTIYNHLNNDNDYNIPKEKDKDGNIIPYKNYKEYDFCIGSKMKGKNIVVSREFKDFKVVDTELHKMNRYFISNEGVDLIKILPPVETSYLTETDKYKIKHDENQLNLFDFIEDVKVDPEERETALEAGWKSTLFNKYRKIEDEEINYRYYIEDCYKIINSLI